MHRVIVLKRLDELTVVDDGTTYHGFDQEWYSKLWQRRAGCGPTTASTLIRYNAKRNKSNSKASSIRLMEELWSFVTPGIMGVHTVAHFTRGLREYLVKKHLGFEIAALSVPIDRANRPSFAQVREFLVSRLEADQPVAFLNLNNGEVGNLDPWHWVTIVGIEQRGADRPLLAHVYDEGRKLVINLTLWYETTTRPGGFVSLVEGGEG